MKPSKFLKFTALILAVAACVSAADAATKGQLVWAESFDTPASLQGWAGSPALEPGRIGTGITISHREVSGAATASRPIATEQVKGCTLRCSGSVRAQDVTGKPNSWNGIKFMMIVQSPGGVSYPQAPLETGTFAWQDAAFTVRVPEDATNLLLVLGLEEVAGKAWFDDVRVIVTKPPPGPMPPPNPGPVFRGHSLPRLRGVMISPNISRDSLRLLGQEWKANLIRWQLIRVGQQAQGSSLEDYDRWLQGELAKLDAALPFCEQYGLMVALDLHSPPGGKLISGGYIASDHNLFRDPACQQKFVDTWRLIGSRYKGSKAIWGYDLVNEPVEEDVADNCDDWPALAERAARAIREIDPSRTIIIEPADWGGPEALNRFRPVPVSNVVYSVHMYLPHAFTHQRLNGQGTAYSYPGEIEGKRWDKAELVKALQPAIAFQQRFNVHLYIGEFSAIRWAPDNSAERYLGDVIDIFEQHGWDWSYHAFREWQGWSVEHGDDFADTKPAETPTRRQNLLRTWFEKNVRPPGK